MHSSSSSDSEDDYDFDEEDDDTGRASATVHLHSKATSKRTGTTNAKTPESRSQVRVRARCEVFEQLEELVYIHIFVRECTRNHRISSECAGTFLRQGLISDDVDALAFGESLEFLDDCRFLLEGLSDQNISTETKFLSYVQSEWCLHLQLVSISISTRRAIALLSMCLE